MHHPINILLVEDDPGDVRFTREALAERSLHPELHMVVVGVQAMENVNIAKCAQTTHSRDSCCPS